MNNFVADEFEKNFLEKDLFRQIENCDRHELTPLFLERLPSHQPVLEAGCGSGKWMHFFKKNGIIATGIDWSQTLRERSLQVDRSIAFDTGDLRNLPYPDGYFGSIVALGSIEHVVDGPEKILKEFRRVLRPGGIAIITVPYYSPVKKYTGFISDIGWRVKRVNFIRRVLGKPEVALLDKRKYKALLENRYRKDVYLQTDFHGNFHQ